MNLNYRTPSRKGQLDELRRQDMVFLELAAQMARIQVDNGDYFILGNPALGVARKTKPIEELGQLPGVHEVVGHTCRFGFKHPVCQLPIRKPTWWMTNASHLARQLGQTCRCEKEHVPCRGGDTAQRAARYYPQLAKAVVRGVVDQLREDDPSRLRALRKALHWRIVREGLSADEAMIRMHSRLAGWFEDHKDNEAYVIIDAGTTAPQEGIEFDAPRDQAGNIPKALLSAVRRMHLNTGHPPNRDLERMCRLAGASPQACILI